MRKKIVYLLLVVVFMLRSVAYVVPASYADDGTTPTPTQDQSQTPTDSPTQAPTDTPSVTPTDTASPTPSDSPTPTDTITPTPSDDPDDATVTPTPTDDPNATDSAVVDPTDASNSADVSNDITSSGDSGDNTTSSSSSNNSSNGNGGSTNVSTGDAANVSTVDNTVNANYANAQVVTQTLNLFFDSNGDIDLTLPEQIAAELLESNSTQPVINAVVTSNNTAVLVNNVVSIANTGDNTASGAGEVAVSTGNAYSVAELDNKVNFTVANSIIHVVTINIFGTLNGNIILPDAYTSQSCAGCGIDEATVGNTATVNNNVNSTANSGNNTVTGGDGTNDVTDLTTGDANSVVDASSLVNSNILGGSFGILFINDFGQWNGNFLGWGDIEDALGGQSLTLATPNADDPSQTVGGVTAITANNTANVQNNVTSVANTGSNNVTGGGSTSLVTGNAYSVVCLQNFVNSTIVNSFGFFGCINIFGVLNGNIGGASQFITPTPTPDPGDGDGSDNSDVSDGPSCSGNTTLDVETSNNTGAYVNPGDTVTFFVTIKNTGSAPANGTTLNLTLQKDGQNMGGASFSVPDMQTGQELHFKTGLVLSSNAPAGVYTAVADVSGTNCDGTSLDGSGTSTFTVGAPNPVLVLSASTNQPGPHHQQKVLGAQIITKSSCASCVWPPFLILEAALLGVYYFVNRKKRTFTKKNKAIFGAIPIVTYILFILFNRDCLGNGFGFIITSGSIFCRLFFLLDLLVAAAAVTLYKSRKSIQKVFAKIQNSKK